MKQSNTPYKNHLAELESFDNRFFAMRHGEGTHNVDGIIISSLERGVKEAPLTPKGKLEVRENSRSFFEDLSRDGYRGKIIVVASPFLRTRESAQELVTSVNKEERRLLGVRPDFIAVDKSFRERFFGVFEGRNAGTYYQEVWDADQYGSIREKTVETPKKVEDRVTRGIVLLNEAFRKRVIVIVSHADPIQIMKTATARIAPQLHHHHPDVQPYIRPAQIIELKIRPRR